MADARKLSAFQKARLRDLYAWRDDLARQQDEAVFRIMPDGLLIPVALFDEGPEAMKGHFRHVTVQRHAAAISRVTEEAAKNPFQASAVPAPEPFLRGRQLERFEKLRQWRNRLAQELSIEPDRVFTNRSLKALVLAQPDSFAALGKVDGMEEWRMTKFGQALWESYASIR